MKAMWDETGAPENLPAAAADAMEWLRLFVVLIDRGQVTLHNHNENRARLGMALESVLRFLESEEKKEAA